MHRSQNARLSAAHLIIDGERSGHSFPLLRKPLHPRDLIDELLTSRFADTDTVASATCCGVCLATFLSRQRKTALVGLESIRNSINR